MRPFRAALLSLTVLLMHAPAALGQSSHEAHHGGAHAAMPEGAPAEMAPTEPGQSAFAAIAEIVALLEADPETDWSTVDIDALRRHLQDMDRVTLHARVAREDLPDGARFHVSGEGEVAGSIRRMTLAHAPFLEQANAWKAVAEVAEDGAILTVTAEDPALAPRIRALGYFGLMAQGAHHQPHHLAMALGQGAHLHGPAH